MFNPENYRKLTAVVLGAGKSGIACANLLKEKGFNVFISDGGKAQIPHGFSGETGGHTAKIFEGGFIIKSPGISSNDELLKKAAAKKIPVFSEAEIALAFMPPHTLCAITGTNGKTTTTVLLGEILKNHAPGKAHILGNVGIPFSQVKVSHGDFVAGEFSSYQLEDSSFIKPKTSAILNITPDHIDHHGSFEAYVEAKAKAFKFQDKNDFCIFNKADKYCMELSLKCPSKVLTFSSHDKTADAFLDDGKIICKFGNIDYSFVPPNLVGVHNLENSMAAALCALTLGANAKVIQQTFNGFKGVEHRIEYCGEIKGIKFYNDSKATNVDSTLIALKALGKEKNIWLLLGGRDKGVPYTPLIELINKYAKAVLVTGEAAPMILRDLEGMVNTINCETIENAASYALKNGASGDIFLFSPACSSFDRFTNFEERGRFFKDYVNKVLTARSYCADTQE